MVWGGEEEWWEVRIRVEAEGWPLARYSWWNLTLPRPCSRQSEPCCAQCRATLYLHAQEGGNTRMPTATSEGSRSSQWWSQHSSPTATAGKHAQSAAMLLPTTMPVLLVHGWKCCLPNVSNENHAQNWKETMHNAGGVWLWEKAPPATSTADKPRMDEFLLAKCPWECKRNPW